MPIKPKFLCVDDEEFNLDIMQYYLTRAGYDVMPAENGAAALQELTGTPGVDIIVLDRMMPVMDGMEFLKTIKADERFEDLPVIMQTAAAQTEQVIEGIKAGVYYYLTKPYSQTVLLSIVKSALDDAHRRKKLREEVRNNRRILGLMDRAAFHFRTLEEAKNLAQHIASCFPKPDIAVYGLHELLINAVEHGNLGISYFEKTKLITSGHWMTEVERRLALPEYAKRHGHLTFEATQDTITVHIKDEGGGFDWHDYLELSPDRGSDPHGRGIFTSRKMSFDRVEYLGDGSEVVCTVSLC